MDTEEPDAGPRILMMPEMPENAGALDTCTELSVGDDYLIDGRVSHGEVACGWNAADVDVDVSLAAYDSNQKCVDVIWWDKKHSHYVACTHLNDDRHGISIKDTHVNEQISIKFGEMPMCVQIVLVVLTVYSKRKTLKDVSDIFAKLSYKDQDLFKFEPPRFDTSAAVIGAFCRSGAWWSFKPLAHAASGRTVKEVVYNKTLNQIICGKQNTVRYTKVSTRVVEGHKLAASDRSLFGRRTSDCFVEIKFRDRRAVSEVILKNLDPKWKMKYFDLGVTNEADYSIIEFNVWDHDTNSPDDFLGCALVAIGGICQRGAGKHTVPFDLGPSSNPENKPKKGVTISGYIVVDFENVEIEG